MCGKEILPNIGQVSTFAQIANRTKETNDTTIAGRKAARTFAVKMLLILTGVNSKPSKVPLSFSPTKLSMLTVLAAIKGIIKKNGDRK